MENTPLVIVNSSAGFKGLSHIREMARQRGYRLVGTEYPGHGREIACRQASAGTPLIIACGGDGTIHEVASGILEAEKMTTMGIIPAATGNDLCRSLDIGEEVEEVFSVLDENRQMEMDVAMLIMGNEKITFLNVLQEVEYVMHRQRLRVIVGENHV
jgi:diacylglycerol kinase family enzyme